MIEEFETATIVSLVIGVGLLLAALGSRVAAVFNVPAPLLFLIGGVAAAQSYDPAAELITVSDVEVVAVFALIFILFEGGFHGGLTRMRQVLRPVALMGVLGTFMTTGLLALVVHYGFGLSPELSALIGIALAPTDPAAVFSVLGNQSVKGRSRIVLEGESGANDPVGIALMLGTVELVAHDHGGIGTIAGEFLLEMVVGVVVGFALGWLMNAFLTHIPLGSPALHALGAIAAAFIIYPITVYLHGSGFLAVFAAGLVIGNASVIEHDTTNSVLSTFAALSEITMFTILGLTVNMTVVQDNLLLGIGIWFVLAIAIRPLVATIVLLPTQLTSQEQSFISWGGLKGAVPILLAGIPIIEHVDGADQVYAVVFVVVTLSMAIQGTSLPLVAKWLGLIDDDDEDEDGAHTGEHSETVE